MFSLIAAALEAIVDVAPKPIMDQDYRTNVTEPLILVLVIYVVNGMLFTPFTRRDVSVENLRKKTIVLLIIIGCVEVLSTIFFLYGLRETTAVNATILLNSEIIFGIIIALFFLMERIQRQEVFPVIMITIGSMIIPFTQDMFFENKESQTLFTTHVLGDSYVLIAGLLLGLVTCLYRRVVEYVSLIRVMQITSFVGAGVSFLLILILGIPIVFDFPSLPTILFIGIFGIGASAFCYMYSLKLIGAVRTILIFSSTTVFGVIFANLILLENILLENIISITLIISGMILLRNKISD